MMAGSPAIRIATQGGGKVADAAPAPGRGDFPAALMAANPAAPRAEPARAERPEARDPQETASDPGVAAAMAALFPSAQAAPALPPGGEEILVDAGIDASGEAGLHADGDLAGLSPDMQAAEFLDAQLAAASEPGTQTGDELLQNLSRELALARDAATSLRAAVDLRAAPGVDAAPGSASSHAATQLSALTASSVTHAAAEQAALRSPVGAPRWSEELGSRLVMMSTRGQNEGSLSLTPEHLGPLEVRISMNQNTANVWFGAHHAETRAALADALPRLREMLAEAGLTLGQSGVSQQAPRQERPEVFSTLAAGSIDAPAAVAAPARRALAGLLDLYA